MKFGYFDDNAKEYVITSPKTPLPWINYLGCEDFFSLVSNTCGGYSFYKDAKLLRLTRYRYNNVPGDSNGHYYYIKEGNTIWNPGWMPTKTDLDSYECHHGIGYSIFKGSKNDLAAELTDFVPIGSTCEINKLTMTNHSKEEKHFSIFSYVEFCLWNAMDDMTNFQRNYSTGEVEIHGSAIYHKTEYRERRNHYAVYSVNAPIAGFDTSRDAFLGAYGENSAPEVVVSGSCKNSVASGWAPVGSHQLDVTLAPGESRTYVFVLGYVENPAAEKWVGRPEDGIINRTPAEKLLEKFNTTEKADQALADLKAYWEKLLSHFTVSSKEEKLDRMVNIWHQYQCMVTFNMSRSASYYESGIGRGMGFRDSCQDLLGFVHLIPDRARQRILDIASTQFEDGSAYHQYQPLTKKGNSDIGSGFNDDPLWLIAGTAAYIKETGDYSILDERTPYDNDDSKATDLMEHLRRSFHYTMEHRGPHKLPLIGRADWNDCLNLNCFSTEPGESFQTFGPSEGPNAESVFIAGMFVRYGKDYVEICRHRGMAEEAALAEEAIADMEKTVLDAGWDGEWFLRAYDHYKNKIVLNKNGELAVKHAQKIIKSIQTMINDVQDYDQSFHSISIATCSPAPMWDIEPLIKELYPQITIQTAVINKKDLLTKLKEKEYHLVITPEYIDDSQYFCIPYVEEDLLLSLPLNHPLASKKEIKFHDLDDQTMLLYSNIGFWHDLHIQKTPKTKYLLQEERLTFNEIVKASTLPSYTSNLSIKREGKMSDRVILPINEEEAHVTYYIVMLKENKKKYKDLIDKIDHYYDY